MPALDDAPMVFEQVSYKPPNRGKMMKIRTRILSLSICCVIPTAITFVAVISVPKETEIWVYEIEGIEYHVERSANTLTGKERITVECDNSLTINKTDGWDYTITKIDKDADGNLLWESKQTYSGTYANPDETMDSP